MLLEKEVEFVTQLNLLVLYGSDNGDASLVTGDH
jgi:hypothetical protein